MNIQNKEAAPNTTESIVMSVENNESSNSVLNSEFKVQKRLQGALSIVG